MVDEVDHLLAAIASADDQAAEAAAHQLAARGGTVLPRLRELASHPETDHRWWALRTLAEMPGDEVVPLLVTALKDENASVRQCAALGLQAHPNTQALPALLDSLSDNDPLVVRLAGNALVSIGASATPALLERLPQEAPRARLELMRVLALIGDQSTIPVLFEALDSDSMLVEYWANEGLERMGVGMMFFKP